MFLLVIGCLALAEALVCWVFAAKAFRHTGRFALPVGFLCIFAGLVCVSAVVPLFVRDATVLRAVGVVFFGSVLMLMTAGVDYALKINIASTATCRRVQAVLSVGNLLDLALLVLNVFMPISVDYSLSYNPNWGFTMTPTFQQPVLIHFAWCYVQALIFTFFVARRAVKVKTMYRAPLVRLLLLIGISVLCNLLYSVRGSLGPLDYCIFIYGFTVLEAYTNAFHYMRGMEYAQVTDVLAQGAPYPVLSFGPGGELLFSNAAATELFDLEHDAATDAITLHDIAQRHSIPQLEREAGLSEFQWRCTDGSGDSYSCEFNKVVDNRGELMGYALTMRKTSGLVDPHTGFYNEDALRAYRLKLQRSGIKPVTVAAISLNHLTPMNERHGRVCADEAVWDFCAKMRAACPLVEGCFVAYRGGGGFAIISTTMTKEGTERELAAFRSSIEWDVPNDIHPDFEYAVVEYDCTGHIENVTMACRKAEEVLKLKRLLSPTSHLSSQANSLVRPLIDRGIITQERVDNRAQLAGVLAREMGEEDEVVYRSALAAKLCNIGKLSLPDSVAFYEGTLPRGARRLLEQHVEVGYRILRAMGSASGVPEAVLHHHERWDGSGYPDSLRGEAIPVEARITSVVCAYDAMVNRSGSLGALTPAQAVGEILANAGTQFDPRAAEALAAVLADETAQADAQAGSQLFVVEEESGQSLAARVVRQNMGRELERYRALVVDDQETNRFLIAEAIKADFDIVEACNGREALDIIAEDERGFDVVLLDLNMPVLDGCGFLRELRVLDNQKDQPPVLVVTADNEPEAWTKCLDLGAAEFLPKPISPGILKRRVSNAVELYSTRKSLQRKVHEQAADIIAKNEELHMQSVQLARTNEQLGAILTNIMEYRDCDTAGHVERVQGFATALAQELVDKHPSFGLTQADVAPLGRAAALHDIGKIAIPDSILFKPGMLTPDEMAVMKTHTLCGYQLISTSLSDRSDSFARFALEVVASHHERWDGTGYPDGLSGSTIPVSAQITALADVYDALTSDRPYKQAISPSVAIDMIVAGECGTFSPVMLELFKEVAPRFEDMYTKELRASGPHDPVEEYRRILQRGFEQGVEVNSAASIENIVHILLDVNAKLATMNRRDRGTGALSRDSYLGYLSAFNSNVLSCVGAAYFDVNGLHEYNRDHGHDQGDVMLANVAGAIIEVFGEDRVFRTGGDEFVAICEDVSKQELDAMVEQVRGLFAQRGLSCSVGSDWREDDMDMDAMIHTADISMFQNKARFYDDNKLRKARGRLSEKW
ncbi:MAG: HD domain-containing phosphohydrolase [Coriobacteriales bacterium]